MLDQIKNDKGEKERLWEGVKFHLEYRRRKTMEIRVMSAKTIRILVPEGIDRDEVEKVLCRKKSWIMNKLILVRTQEAKKIVRTYTKGEIFYYMGRKYGLDIRDSDKSKVLLEENKMVVYRPKDGRVSIQKVIESWYREATKERIMERIAYYQPYFQVQPQKVRIKNQKTRWGSCSSKQNLNFNLRLSMAPLFVLDYIVVHEMSHFVEMNHSNRFWNQVERVLPNYQEAKDWLKENSSYMDL